MKKFTVTMLVSITLLSVTITKSFAQTDQEQRIHAAYMIAFGRDASAADVNYWKGQGNLSLAQLISKNQQYLKQDAGTHNTTIDRAYQDALGRHATTGELNYWKAGIDTYVTLMKNNLNWLKSNPAEYEKVIKNSYQYVFGRQPNAAEIAYWKGQGTVSYLILVGFHEDWKRKNMSNQKESGSGVNLKGLSNITAVSLSSSAVTLEAKSALGSSSSVLAIGAANLITQDGGGLIASGGGNLIASGGGN